LDLCFLTKILGLNDTQGGVVAMIFKYCDDNKLPLLDMKDFIKVLQYVGNKGKAELQITYGKISTTSTGTILRKMIELQQKGADTFFGDKSFEVEDLMRMSDDERGMISVLRVTDLRINLNSSLHLCCRCSQNFMLFAMKKEI